MKKVFFAFVAASVMVLASCNNKPAEGGDATPADSTATTNAAENVSTTAPDTTAAAVAATGETAASGSTGTTEAAK